MFQFLGFLFVAVIAILLIGLAVISKVISSIFGLGKRSSSSQTRSQQTYRPEDKREPEAHPHSEHQKIFDKNEGEYVDFEEVKE